MRLSEPNWFIALTVDPGEWYAPLLRTIPRHIRAYNANDLHLTVAFLRDCGETRARKAFEGIEGQFERPLTFVLGGVDSFGNRWRPSAMGLTSSVPDNEVEVFLRSVRDLATFTAEVEPDTRPPKPHITLIRPPKRGTLEEVREILDWATGTAPLELPIELRRLALYTRSVERGRQFRIVAEKVL